MDEFRQKFFLPFFVTCSLITHAIYAANDTINIGQNITGGETLVSAGGIFELGFWTPGSSGNRYVAMWYKNTTAFPVAVWIANRQVPIRDKSGVLTVTKPGILVLLNDTGAIVWNSTASRPLQNPVAQLLDSGNLVVKDANDDRPENYVWQSFDHPTDTYLPGMKIGWNFVTGVETYLSSWTSNDDPGSGEFSLHMDPTGYPQIVVKKGEAVLFRALPRTGFQLSGPPDSISRLTLEMNKNEVYYKEDTFNGSNWWRSLLYQSGESQRFGRSSLAQDWVLYRKIPDPNDTCDSSYNFCGAYGICNPGNSPLCGCLHGFVSRKSKGLVQANGSTACIRRTPLNCSRSRQDVFLNYSGIKLPDARHSVFSNQSVNIDDCELKCLINCSCMAYTQLDKGSEGGRGCLLYYGELVDIKNLSQGGHDLYIRVDPSELVNVAEGSKGNKRVILIASLTSAVGAILLVLGLSLIIYNRKRKSDPNMRIEGPPTVSQRNDSELPLFELSTILKATDNFSIDNRLGQGGFGAVYRGVLDNGEEIAVKRLSKSSRQGVDELKNEVILIAKLQHRNLVRLLGCCLEGEENMLIYEYVPNKSLDQIIFDQSKSMLLDWQKRFNIISGIAKGLLYLHQDSRLRIIHRDLKASNILLDSEMNPRISDFGLARIFGGNESTEVQTSKVVGTFGYMPPEYMADGLFSVKSDVFSFGVLVLEIVSGKKNRGLISLGNHYLNLLGHAWKLDREGDPLTLVDAVLGDAFDSSEVLRSIHVALLCVQMYPEDRPNMSSVVFMLGNEVAVPQAKQPGFYAEKEVLVADISTSTKATSSASGASSTSTRATGSVNEVTITYPVGR